MALSAYMSIKGSKHGQIKVLRSKSPLSDKWLDIVAFNMAVETPHDSSSGSAKGPRQHKPIKITKETDSSSPVLFQMCSTNEVLIEVIFEFKFNGHTTRKITLRDGAIVKVSPATKIPHGPASHHGSGSGGHYEEIEIAFEKIEYENASGSTTATDDWEASS